MIVFFVTIAAVLGLLCIYKMLCCWMWETRLDAERKAHLETMVRNQEMIRRMECELMKYHEIVTGGSNATEEWPEVIK